MIINNNSEVFTVLGIDASLTGTGLCLLTNDFLNNKSFRSTTLKNNLKGIPRILFIEKEIEKWAEKADMIVIENYAYEKKYNREVLAELQGVLKRRLYLMNKNVLIVNTQKVKKILTGQGRKPKVFKDMNTKKWTIQETYKNYHIDFRNKDNECDAFGLALIGLFYLLYTNNSKSIEKYEMQTKVIKEIITPQKNNKKKTIYYYYNLPYKIQIIENNKDEFLAKCPGLDYVWKGQSAEEALKNAINNKKNRIKELKKEKKKIKTAKRYMGGISYIKKIK